MTDREMLELCIEAFAATLTADKARKLLKKMGAQPKAYAGVGSHILAKAMADKIRTHLDASC